ncbi:MAG: LysR substrate-binding domain-containing protein [Solirubrobacteraceae bacterium]
MLRSDGPDLLALDLLRSVAELESLGRVARRHGMSQPAVSMRMSQLEVRLGLRLLRRGPTGTRLTPAGEEVLSLSRRVLGEMEALMSAVQGLRAQESSRLRVAASLTVAASLLPEWVEALRESAPEMSLSLEVANSTIVLDRLVTGGVDIGFVEGREHEHPGLESTVVGDDRLLVVVAPEHPWATRATPVSGSELAGSELLVREEGSGTREVIEAALEPWGGIRTRLELGSIETIVGAVRRGGLPAVLSALTVAEDLAAGRLVQVRTTGVSFTRHLRALWSDEHPLPPLAGRLLALAHKQSG